jgi:predicted nucleotidyltransferase
LKFLVILYSAPPAPENARLIGGPSGFGYNYFECCDFFRWNKTKALAQTRWYRGMDVPMRVIRRWARQVAERFKPDKIILFGSHAYGTPHEDSDVDILVVMPCRSQRAQAFRIRTTTPAPFPMDLLVRKPGEIKWRLEEGELFHSEIVSKGKVLYETEDARVGKRVRSCESRDKR